MSCSDTKGVVADINMRIELKRMIDRTLAMNNGPLAAILQVAVGTLDERIAQPQSHAPAKEESPSSHMICRNVRIDGRRTSVKLESEYWQVLETMASESDGCLDKMCEMARREHPHRSLASALRVYTLAMLTRTADRRLPFADEGSVSISKRSGRKRQS